MRLYKKLYFRICQRIAWTACFMPWKRPEIIDLKNGISDLPAFILGKQHSKLYIVISNSMLNLGTCKSFFDNLDNLNIKYEIYHNVKKNPTIENIEEAYADYFNNDCDFIVAIGGGSVIDCAKGVAIRAARPDKKLKDLNGALKIMKKLPPIVAVPTCGTGNETTMHMTYVDASEKRKNYIFDINVIPSFVLLDPKLTLTLPKEMVAISVMETLTHATETYLGYSNTFLTKEMAVKSVKTIFENIESVLQEPENLTARKNLMFASCEAGLAFTGTFAGYTYAIANSVCGLYGISHGLVSAIALPYVLEYYGKKATKKLSHLADFAALLDDSPKVKAKMYVDAIRDLADKMNMPKTIDIKKEDIPLLVERAYSESIKTYPVPKLMTRKDFKNIFIKISTKLS